MNIEKEIKKETERLQLDMIEIKHSLETTRNHYADKLLNGTMGKDIEKVTSGEVLVEFSKLEKIRYSIKCFFKKIMRII